MKIFSIFNSISSFRLITLAGNVGRKDSQAARKEKDVSGQYYWQGPARRTKGTEKTLLFPLPRINIYSLPHSLSSPFPIGFACSRARDVVWEFLIIFNVETNCTERSVKPCSHLHISQTVVLVQEGIHFELYFGLCTFWAHIKRTKYEVVLL